MPLKDKNHINLTLYYSMECGHCASFEFLQPLVCLALLVIMQHLHQWVNRHHHGETSSASLYSIKTLYNLPVQWPRALLRLLLQLQCGHLPAENVLKLKADSFCSAQPCDVVKRHWEGCGLSQLQLYSVMTSMFTHWRRFS